MSARILIVEDEAVVALELRFVLEDLGHEVVGAAADAAGARAMARQGDFDLALVDIHLSDGPTGVEVGRELARSGALVLYITANPGMLGDGVSGAVGVLTKPSDERAVQTAVDYVLRRRDGDPDVAPPRELRLFG